jgi:hypothetical protein
MTSRQATWQYVVKADAAPLFQQTYHSRLYIQYQTQPRHGWQYGDRAQQYTKTLGFNYQTIRERKTRWPAHLYTLLHSDTYVSFTRLYHAPTHATLQTRQSLKSKKT